MGWSASGGRRGRTEGEEDGEMDGGGGDEWRRRKGEVEMNGGGGGWKWRRWMTEGDVNGEGVKGRKGGVRKRRKERWMGKGGPDGGEY